MKKGTDAAPRPEVSKIQDTDATVVGSDSSGAKFKADRIRSILARWPTLSNLLGLDSAVSDDQLCSFFDQHLDLARTIGIIPDVEVDEDDEDDLGRRSRQIRARQAAAKERAVGLRRELGLPEV